MSRRQIVVSGTRKKGKEERDIFTLPKLCFMDDHCSCHEILISVLVNQLSFNCSARLPETDVGAEGNSECEGTCIFICVSGKKNPEE